MTRGADRPHLERAPVREDGRGDKVVGELEEGGKVRGGDLDVLGELDPEHCVLDLAARRDNQVERWPVARRVLDGKVCVLDARRHGRHETRVDRGDGAARGVVDGEQDGKGRAEHDNILVNVDRDGDGLGVGEGGEEGVASDLFRRTAHQRPAVQHRLLEEGVEVEAQRRVRGEAVAVLQRVDGDRRVQVHRGGAAAAALRARQLALLEPPDEVVRDGLEGGKERVVHARARIKPDRLARARARVQVREGERGGEAAGEGKAEADEKGRQVELKTLGKRLLQRKDRVDEDAARAPRPHAALPRVSAPRDRLP